MDKPVLYMYKFRYFDKVRKKWIAPTWRMTKEDITETYGDTQYEVIESSVEERRNSARMMSTPPPK